LARSEALSLRLAETDPADPVPLAIWRALRACRAIGQDSVSLTSSPDLADLATLSAEELDDLALAEDQAGFIGEYLAALTQVGELRDALTQAAALHRARASGLAGMADSPDPRAVVYRLGEQPVDEATIRARWATAELALASHYAELPVTAQAEAFLCWQLAQAHAWGAELPDLPFLTPPAN
jgi:hypothetical protein